MMDSHRQTRDAAEYLCNTWNNGKKIDALPIELQPNTREDGYKIATEMTKLRRESVLGWKIAATSKAGQAHINVDGPLAGQLYESRILQSDSRISLAHNLMRVAEIEFAFQFGTALERKARPYTLPEVMNAVASLHLSIEVPDSRYRDFTKVGAANLIADTACADWLVLGPAITKDWRQLDLPNFVVKGFKNGQQIAQGTGNAALGDPCLALTWLVNEVTRYAGGIKAGNVVTTGTCVIPVPMDAGDRFLADYGELGQIAVLFE